MLCSLWVFAVVALLAEGVDRNRIGYLTATFNFLVALLAEGVDRNKVYCAYDEIVEVALLAEGVDRNMSEAHRPSMNSAVALLAEGVDRNDSVYVLLSRCMSRPPRGGRG